MIGTLAKNCRDRFEIPENHRIEFPSPALTGGPGLALERPREEYVDDPTCSWQLEGPATEGGGSADLPYCITPVNAWYNWYGYGPVVGSCP